MKGDAKYVINPIDVIIDSTGNSGVMDAGTLVVVKPQSAIGGIEVEKYGLASGWVMPAGFLGTKKEASSFADGDAAVVHMKGDYMEHVAGEAFSAGQQLQWNSADGKMYKHNNSALVGIALTKSDGADSVFIMKIGAEF